MIDKYPFFSIIFYSYCHICFESNSSPYARKGFSALFGDGAALIYVITHSLNSQDVDVTIRRNSGAFDQIACDIEMTSVNSITLRFAAAPSTNQFKVIIGRVV